MIPTITAQKWPGLNYSWIFGVLAFCWLTKVSIHPTPIVHFSEIFDRAAVFHFLPGWVVIGVGIVVNLLLIIIALITLKPREEVVRIYPSNMSTFKIGNF